MHQGVHVQVSWKHPCTLTVDRIKNNEHHHQTKPQIQMMVTTVEEVVVVIVVDDIEKPLIE